MMNALDVVLPPAVPFTSTQHLSFNFPILREQRNQSQAAI